MSDTSELIAQQILNSNITKRSWNDLLVNVKAYGAVGNGVTDDSIAFNNAVAAIKSAGGGILRIPPGKFVLSTPITITDTDIVIEGSGMQLTQLFFTGSNGIVYSSTNLFSDCIHIRDLSVITTTNNLYTGIDISFPSNIGSPWRNTSIENVTVASTTSISAYNDGTNNSQSGSQNWANGIHLKHSAVSVIRDCVIRAGQAGTTESGGNGIWTEGFTVDILIQGCKIYSADVGIRKNDVGEGLVIDNCMLINVDTGIYINQGATSLSGVYASIQNSHINYYSSGIIATYHPQITVQNCLIYKQGSLTGGSDINLDRCDRSKILSNTCIVNSGTGSTNGIILDNSTNCLIHDNIVEERVTGVWLKASATNCRLFGNRVTGNTTNILDSGSGNYREKVFYEASVVLTPSGTVYNADVTLPTGFFTTKPTTGFMTSASTTEDILGFYDYDSTSSTSSNARFRLVKKDGTAFAGVPTRFNVIVYE